MAQYLPPRAAQGQLDFDDWGLWWRRRVWEWKGGLRVYLGSLEF